MRAPERWSPWWAIVITCVSLLLPLGVLAFGFQQLSYGRSGKYMSELAAAMAPLVLAVGAILLVPGVLYLVLRRRILFFVTIAVTVGALLVPALVQFF